VIAAIVALSVVCLALLTLLRAQARDHRYERENADARWQAERSELINRIQRPDVLPTRPRREPREPREPKDTVELARVGTVVPLHPDGEGEAG
jgi:hypothetical protein